VSMSPSTINFGDVTVGSTSDQTVTVANTGNSNVNVTAANVSGAGFSAVGFVAGTLTPGQTMMFTARFAPSATGVASGSITLSSTATNNPSVSLSGNGTPLPIGTLTLNPTSINFGSVIVGNTTSQTVTMNNTGTASLTISSAPVSGAGFSITGLTLPLTLGIGALSSFTVQFAPGSAGAVSGSVSLTSDASNSPTNLALSGTGVAQTLTVSMSPSTINFGDVTVGSTSDQTVTVANTGNSNVSVSAANVTGTGFSVVGFVAGTLTPGQTMMFTARFAPSASGAVAGSITLTSTATNNPTVTLAGTGAAPPPGQLTINPNGIDFGSVVVGSNATNTITLTNIGSSPVTISQANVTGATFTVSDLSLPLTLNAGQITTFTVKFTPTGTGSFTGSVSIVSDASNSPTVLSLTGTGTIGVTLLWDASTSTVVGYSVYRAATAGGPYVKLNASIIPGTTYIDSSAQGGHTYFYVATAVDADGIESIFSNELNVILP
jgi:hypothetical protein